MANDMKSRQQSSERAQTSSSGAQQGEWQPGQRGSTGGMQGNYPQQTQGRGDIARRESENYFPSFGPFSMMRRLTDDMDRLFESFGLGLGRGAFPDVWSGGIGREGGLQVWSPRIEVREKEGKLCISADLPGVKKDDVKVEIDDNAVTIQGERREERTTDERGYYQSERSYGSFYRTIPLPEGTQADDAKAEFKDGVLEIEIPAPKSASKGRRLEIKG